jgi:hypothetical protein
MKTIYKYPLYLGYNCLTVPGENVKPLKFARQLGQYYVWIEHEMTGSSTLLDLQVIGTGYSIGSEYSHIDTMFEGEFVWHLFYRVIN